MTAPFNQPEWAEHVADSCRTLDAYDSGRKPMNADDYRHVAAKLEALVRQVRTPQTLYLPSAAYRHAAENVYFEANRRLLEPRRLALRAAAEAQVLDALQRTLKLRKAD
ncbi:hypothetical protein [Derxia lacustris]|uniref:hypothetical protein n=1 Tax=Derxia lacustris TaxID=764842 RepID=UPI000A16D605|nr:hypothetical protein [Derxia lacustris]